MNIHLLIFDDRVEQASCDGKKIQQLADEGNGYDERGCVLAGPYFALAIELEDLPKSLLDPSMQRLKNISEYNADCICHVMDTDQCPIHD